MSGARLCTVIATSPSSEPSSSAPPANTLPASIKTEKESVPTFEADQIVLSPDLEKELCLSINRELHVSYCYLVMGGIFTRFITYHVRYLSDRGVPGRV